jgi:Na+/melibiose symporter-like transporter
MGSNLAKWATLAGAAIIIFAVTVLVGLQILPAPHKEMDYLVIGCVATLFSLSVLFAMLLATWMKSPHPFFRKRLKAVVPDDPPQN